MKKESELNKTIYPDFSSTRNKQVNSVPQKQTRSVREVTV